MQPVVNMWECVAFLEAGCVCLAGRAAAHSGLREDLAGQQEDLSWHEIGGNTHGYDTGDTEQELVHNDDNLDCNAHVAHWKFWMRK